MKSRDFRMPIISVNPRRKKGMALSELNLLISLSTHNPQFPIIAVSSDLLNSASSFLVDFFSWILQLKDFQGRCRFQSEVKVLIWFSFLKFRPGTEGGTYSKNQKDGSMAELVFYADCEPCSIWALNLTLPSPPCSMPGSGQSIVNTSPKRSIPLATSRMILLSKSANGFMAVTQYGPVDNCPLSKGGQTLKTYLCPGLSPAKQYVDSTTSATMRYLL